MFAFSTCNEKGSIEKIKNFVTPHRINLWNVFWKDRLDCQIFLRSFYFGISIPINLKLKVGECFVEVFRNAGECNFSPLREQPSICLVFLPACLSVCRATLAGFCLKGAHTKEEEEEEV